MTRVCLALSVVEFSCTSDVEWLVSSTFIRTEGETKNKTRKDRKVSWEKPHLPPSVTENARMRGTWPPLLMVYCWCCSAPGIATFPPLSNTKCVELIQLDFWRPLRLLVGAAGVCWSDYRQSAAAVHEERHSEQWVVVWILRGCSLVRAFLRASSSFLVACIYTDRHLCLVPGFP